MTKFGRSTYGNKLISAFLPKGYTQYGVKGTGEYANYILKIMQFNTDENWYYTGEKHGSVKYGSIVPGEENGTLMFILLLDLRNKYLVNLCYETFCESIIIPNSCHCDGIM